MCKMLTFVLIFAPFIPGEVRLLLLKPNPVSLVSGTTYLHLPISFLHLQTFSSTGSFPSRDKICSFSHMPSLEHSPSPPEGVCSHSMLPFSLLLSTPHPSAFGLSAHQYIFTALAKDANIYLCARSSGHPLLILLDSSSAFDTIKLSLTETLSSKAQALLIFFLLSSPRSFLFLCLSLKC